MVLWLLSRKRLITGSALMVLILVIIHLSSLEALLRLKSPKPWFLSTKARLGDEYTLWSPSVCLPWLVGTGVAFYPSPWPSVSKWPSISAFVKAINRAVQA